MVWQAVAAQAFLKGLSALGKAKSKKATQKDKNRANTNALNIDQKKAEDARRAKVRAGASLLGSVPKTTAGGGVSTNVGLDPGLIADLDKERTYDYSSAMPKPGTGFWWDFLAGLSGEAGDVVGEAYGKQAGSTYGNGEGVRPTGSPGSLVTPPGGVTKTPFVEAGGQGSSLSWEDLIDLAGYKGQS